LTLEGVGCNITLGNRRGVFATSILEMRPDEFAPRRTPAKPLRFVQSAAVAVIVDSNVEVGASPSRGSKDATI
jgi:hypothetical protein